MATITVSATDSTGATANTSVDATTNTTAIPITNFNGADGSVINLAGKAWEVQNANQSWSLQSPDQFTLRFEERSGDLWNGTERTEISGGIQTLYPSGTSIQIDYDFMVESTPATSTWLTCGQFHNDDIGSSPPYELEVNNDRMTILIGSTTQPLGTPAPTGQFNYQSQRYGYIYTDPNPLTHGVYYAMRIQILFSTTSSGYCRVWRNGVQLCNYSGPIGFNFGNGTYWKQGIYRASSTQTLILRYRNLIITP